MDYIYNERNVSSRTYNNYVKFGRAFFNWAKEKCYVKENPFEAVKIKKSQEKQRIIIPPNVREEIINSLNASYYEKNYLLILKLIYSALLRPAEIRQLKIKDIDLKNKTITVKYDIEK